MTFGQPIGQADLQSVGTPIEASDGQESVHQVSLTFCQPLGEADLQSDGPIIEAAGGQDQY